MRDCLKNEAAYRTSRASGPGGQHVNKVESRVELRWDLEASACIPEEKKDVLRERLAPRLTGEGVLLLSCERHRSQLRNKTEVTDRFLDLVEKHMVTGRKRRPTRPTRRSVEERIRTKKQRGEVKQKRKKPPLP